MIKVYSGETVKDSEAYHPVQAVYKAQEIVLKGEGVVRTNNPEMVAGLKYIGEANGVEVELYLNGELASIEKVFEDFNRAMEILDELSH